MTFSMHEGKSYIPVGWLLFNINLEWIFTY